MKMAKASEQDMEAALALSRAIEDLERGSLPEGMDDPDSETRSDYIPRNHAADVVEHLVGMFKRASLFRVTFGMTVLLDPRNELVDPDSDTLERHPKITAALADAERYRGLLLWTLYHHQGASSYVGQPIRRALGIGQFDHLTPEQIAEGKAAAKQGSDL